MKKTIVLLLTLTSLLFAQNMQENKKMPKMFQSVPMEKATLLQKGKDKMFCPVCGMTLPMFYKTNHAATDHGHTKQYCSMHCLAQDSIKNGFKADEIKVVDVKSLKFIDALRATYVVGSKKKGTMTMKSKYAFLNKDDAQMFHQKNGGEIMSFLSAYGNTKKSLDQQMEKVTKKQKKMAKMGGKIYTKMCKKTDKRFDSTAKAKTFLKSSKICGNINGKKLQAVGLYLAGK